MSFEGILRAAATFAALAPAVGLANAKMLQEALNLSTAASSLDGPDATEQCARLSEKIVTLRRNAVNEANVKRALSFAEKALRTRCEPVVGPLNLWRPVETNPVLERTPLPGEGGGWQNSDSEGNDIPAVSGVFWQDNPVCAQDRNVKRCSYGHAYGKGLFIYSQPSRTSLPNYLVCVSRSSKSSHLFGSSYLIDSKCEVSNVHWDSYLRLDAMGGGIRTDLQGFLDWQRSDSMGSPIEIPQLLANQCQEAFGNALMCSPIFIALSTGIRDVVDVCRLQTDRSAFRVAYIGISSASSRWKCRRIDMAVGPERRTRSVEEDRCRSDFFGDIERNCALPTIPRQQNDFSTRDPHPR